MENEDVNIAKLAAVSNINPTEFDVTVSALLLGLGAEKYVDIFRKKNIGQTTLWELSNEDLIKLGVDDAEIRIKLLEQVKNLPLYDDTATQFPKVNNNLSSLEIAEILGDSSQHLYRIYLSVLANTLAVKKTKKILDCLIHEDKYASEVAVATICEMTNILNSMDIAIHTQLKTLTKTTTSNRNKKIVIGAFGSALIAVLSVLFVKSLKELN